MITFKNKQELVEAYEDIDKPLDAGIITDLDGVSRELLIDDISQKLAVLKIRCRVCSYEETTIVPEVADLDNLECRNCGSRSCQEIDNL